jgi:2-aminoadipate transaminase
MHFTLSTKATASAAPYAGLPKYHFVGGNIDEPTVPADDLADAMATVLRREGTAMGKYGMNSGMQGYLPLREFICNSLAKSAQMTITPDEVLLTSGYLQAIDLVNAALLNAGDTVIVESGNYAGALSKLRALGVNFIGIDLDQHGMKMDALETALETLATQNITPKYIFTIPTVQNPTGTVMPVERRHQMLALASKYNVPIFEDDCYADLIFDGTRPPAIHALDTENRVIYCGTYSKTIAPALRVGYLIAPWPLMGYILPLKTDAGSGALEQMTLAEYLPKHFDAHLAKTRPMLQAKAKALTDALDEHFGAAAEYNTPIAGIYLWVTLPETVNTDRLFVAALKHGVEINPGSQWTVDGPANTRRMRICFGHPSIETIQDGIAKLAQICFQEFGVPIRSGNIERS